MRVLRDFVSYVVCCVVACVVACVVGMGAGLFFHDFSAVFHRVQRHEGRNTALLALGRRRRHECRRGTLKRAPLLIQ